MTIYLDVKLKDRERVLALGARLEKSSGKIFVPDEMSATVFAAWILPTRKRLAIIPDISSASPGITLTALLKRTEGAIHQAFSHPEWVRFEISEIRANNGHLYLVAIDRDSAGNEISKCKAVIWKRQANSLNNKFFTATHSQLVSGIKILAYAQPMFDAQFGFCLVISDIDPRYTLGDMEAKLKRIRELIHSKGYAHKNKSLAPPKDFFRVAVIAPSNAAGLEDFKVEADRLSQAGLCQFIYFYATFQGDQTQATLKQAFIDANTYHTQTAIDVLVIIRGGGAAADLHWLNDELLARMVCRFPVPIYTGIGHERDSTILDEYAHKNFGTPSKVIFHIAQTIALNAKHALAHWDEIRHTAITRLSNAESKAIYLKDTIRSSVDKRLSNASFATETHLHHVNTEAVALLDVATLKITATHTAISSAALLSLTIAQRNIDNVLMRMKDRTYTTLTTAVTNIEHAHEAIHLAARRTIDGIDEHIQDRWMRVANAASSIVEEGISDIKRHLGDVNFFAKKNLIRAETHSKELMEEILAHGVAPTLRRGFAII
ncbi:MAG: exodeoxyribonuclease VII large subunit, partial [Pseudomonadota bacterium]